MKAYCFFLITTYSFFSASCQNSTPTQVQQTYPYTIEGSEEIVLAVDENNSFMPQYMHVFQTEGKDYLAYLGKPASEILIFNLESKTLQQKVPLGNEKQKVGETAGVYIHSRDSIFAVSKQSLQIYLLNSIGEVIRAYPEERLPLYSIHTFKKLAFLPQSRELVFHWTPYKKTNKAGFFIGETLSFALNIDTGEQRPFFAYEGKNECFGHDMTVWWSATQANNDILYSFPFDEQLYLQSAKGVKAISGAKGDFFSEIVPLKEDANDEESIAYYMASCSYQAIIADAYRNVYYRIACLPAQKADSKNYTSGKPFSIIVLDSAFQKIAESEVFPENVYDYTQFFVSAEGLFISTNNPARNDLEEDKLRFRKFVLAKK
jgi:hypothetical protein